METLLRYEHVDISYLGQPAVQDVSFTLSPGEIPVSYTHLRAHET